MKYLNIDGGTIRSEDLEQLLETKLKLGSYVIDKEHSTLEKLAIDFRPDCVLQVTSFAPEPNNIINGREYINVKYSFIETIGNKKEEYILSLRYDVSNSYVCCELLAEDGKMIAHCEFQIAPTNFELVAINTFIDNYYVLAGVDRVHLTVDDLKTITFRFD